METMMQIHAEPLFATALVIDRLEDVGIAATLDALLFEGVAVDRGTGRPRKVDWRDAWPASLRVLSSHVRALADRGTAGANGHPATVDWRITGSAYEIAHGEHLDLRPDYEAFWRCLHIVDDGYAGRTEQSLGGELVFLDPRLPAPMIEMAGLRVKTVLAPQAALYSPEVTVRPGSGSILMFPGWMQLRHRMMGARTRPRRLIDISLIAALGSA
ncbi:hypothetical protein F9288_20590 [Sphingomonas sp. CL5.1]|uniref:hypothetical protein n=1 Tax=Sphingomonas sp. CL5.1 TaxID=2653203 RepID=UPI001583D99A|nr:hypothetical protein [Sphingomonas sp. CL5.1]QKS01745.1 hypothetical protein F9288_20590 [Sphingomonas sp. CL5.1]